jgi:hypothetical protein
MTAEKVTKRLIELCTKGKFLEAQRELYDQDIISIETDGSKTIGLSKMQVKEQRFLDNVEKIYKIELSEPLIAGNYFSVILKMELDLKNIGRRKMEEICIYQVKNSKIVFEQFFRDVN